MTDATQHTGQAYHPHLASNGATLRSLRIEAVILVVLTVALAVFAFTHSPVDPNDLAAALALGDGDWMLKPRVYYACLFIATVMGGLAAWCLYLVYEAEGELP